MLHTSVATVEGEPVTTVSVAMLYMYFDRRMVVGTSFLTKPEAYAIRAVQIPTLLSWTYVVLRNHLPNVEGVIATKLT